MAAACAGSAVGRTCLFNRLLDQEGRGRNDQGCRPSPRAIGSGDRDQSHCLRRSWPDAIYLPSRVAIEVSDVARWTLPWQKVVALSVENVLRAPSEPKSTNHSPR